jgi:hypothetical protein
MMEALRSSESSILTKATRRNIPGDGILQHLMEFNNKMWVDLGNYSHT